MTLTSSGKWSRIPRRNARRGLRLDDIADVYKKLMLRHNGKLVSMPYDGDVHMMFWNKVAFERPDNKKKFKAKYGYDLIPPKTWKQWDDQSEFFH